MTWRKQIGVPVAVWLAIAFGSIALILTLHRYYTFYASYDQGIFNQVFWNNLHGNWFQSSLSSNLSTNVVHDGDIPEVFYRRLGQHFTPALLLWLPLYALFPAPVTLTVLQVVLVTAAGLVLYALARHHLSVRLSTLIVASYYGANTILGPTLNNFHDICQIPLYVFGLLLAIEKRWWWLFTLLAILIPFVREDSGVILFSIGFFLAVTRRFPRLGLLVCIWSFGYMIVLTNLIMPIFSEDISRRFMIERFGQYAEGDEASTIEIIWGIISNPGLVLIEIFTPFWDTLRYLLGQWLPLMFVPAIAPEAWLAAGAPLLKQFLAQGESVFGINIRYAMTVFPGLAYGTILWWKRHPNLLRPRLEKIWIGCIILSLIFTITSNPNRTLSFLIPDSIDPWVHVSLPQQWSHAAHARSMLKLIPPDASVSATTYLVPHLSGRRAIIRFPALNYRNDQRQDVSVEYAIADLWQLQQYGVAFDRDQELLEASLRLIPRFMRQQQYGIVGFSDGVVVLQKDRPSNPEARAAWQAFRKALSD
ncbi:DUF2079 domain-containing protein [Microcoleus sp. FACHB-1515]|uniref:DUF2079 domain-containing protein n=1 Tax=Cyanophyceae TaxID=3028117 RepID=UPI0016874F51|nr:DUF2079 domain-containing protein [Microcoleus sp. FACHB-1515]MBD2092933.1 DUF2079 domain-containing protein [Microcoleus sp. FACHB-1515]